MKDNCEIKVPHLNNPRSFNFVAYDYEDWITLEFTSEVRAARAGRTLQVECGEQGIDYSTNSKVQLTLPQAKKMREFLDHFIKTEETTNG